MFHLQLLNLTTFLLESKYQIANKMVLVLGNAPSNVNKMVRGVRIELTCNQLTFLRLIRARVYPRISSIKSSVFSCSPNEDKFQRTGNKVDLHYLVYCLSFHQIRAARATLLLIQTSWYPHHFFLAP